MYGVNQNSLMVNNLKSSGYSSGSETKLRVEELGNGQQIEMTDKSSDSNGELRRHDSESQPRSLSDSSLFGSLRLKVLRTSVEDTSKPPAALPLHPYPHSRCR